MTDAHRRDPRSDETSQHGLRDSLAGARETAGRAIEASRQAVDRAARRTASGFEANPLGLLVGGLAVGAAAGALLPRSEREKDLLAPVGTRLAETARGALAAAKEAGQGQLDELGISREAAQGQARSLLDGLVKAATAAGTAAAKAPLAKGE